MAASLLAGVFSTAAFAHDMQDTPAENASHEVAAGDTVGAYTVLSVSYSPAYDSTVYVYEHNLSKAKVEFIQNDDPNRYFMLKFATHPGNNKGIAHVFEHSVMNGSVKYPSRTLTMAIPNRSYVSFMNAATARSYTYFPIASQSEAQLLSFADLYSDLCFEPLILSDEDIFKSEAWRLSLDDVDGKVGVNGTVYSEMNGRYNAEDMAYAKAMGLLYRGCDNSYYSGGIPSEILTLTYDEVKQFHNRYYVPSNCTAYISGDISDIGAFLDLLDGYFTKFDRPAEGADKEKADDAGDRASGYVEMKYDFPARAGDDDPNNTTMVYAVDLGAPKDGELEELYAFAKSQDLEYSTLKLTLKSLFPGSKFEVSLIPDNGNAVLMISANGMMDDEAPVLRHAILGVFATMAGEGITDDELEYYRARMEAEIALSREGDKSTLEMLQGIINYDSAGRDGMFYLKMRDRMQDMEWFDGDLVQDIAAKYFAHPDRSVMSVMTKDHELYEAEQKALDDELSKLTDSMSKEEKQKLVEDTKRIVAKSKDDPTEYLRKVSVVSVDDLEDEMKVFDVSDDTDEAGVRHLNVYTGTEDIIANELYLDAKGLPQDDLLYLALFTDLVNGNFVPTSGHETGVMPYDLSKCTIEGMAISLNVSDLGDDFSPYVTASFKCGPDDLERAYELLYERLAQSDLSDPALIKEGITAVKSVVKSNIDGNPVNIARHLAGAADAAGMAYYEYTHYCEYYDFLCQLENDIDKNPKNICAKIKSAGQYVMNRPGAISGCALSAKNQEVHDRVEGEFFSKLGNKKHKRTEYDLAGRIMPAAVSIDSRVAANSVAINAPKHGLDANRAYDMLTLSIMSEKYLMPNTRAKYGAYNCGYMDMYPVIAFYTGDDPMIAETFDTFSGMGKAWKDIHAALTDEDINDYIIRMYSSVTLSKGEVNDAKNLITNIVSGRSYDYRKVIADELRNFDMSELDRYDDFYEEFGKEGALATVGSPDLIEKNADAFATVTSLGGKD